MTISLGSRPFLHSQDPQWRFGLLPSAVALQVWAPALGSRAAGLAFLAVGQCSNVENMLDDAVRALASGPNFAALTTLMPGGQPQTHVMWVDCDDDHILINTEVHRRKFKNVQADPRVTVAIWDAGNPYSFAEVRGQVVETITGPAAIDSINALANKYTGNDYSPEIQSERVVLRIAPDRQISR